MNIIRVSLFAFRYLDPKLSIFSTFISAIIIHLGVHLNFLEIHEIQKFIYRADINNLKLPSRKASRLNKIPI